jgi:hypothetical protein
MTKNICYIHVCTRGAGLQILHDMLTYIYNSKIIHELSSIVVSVVGSLTSQQMQMIQNFRLALDQNENKKGIESEIRDYVVIPECNIEVIHVSKKDRAYEFPTLKMIQNRARNSNENYRILYMHTKGVLHTRNKYVTKWRLFMQYFLVDHYENCLQRLEKHNLVGCDFYTKPFNHFRGNFWWANSDFIAKNSDIDSMNQNQRYDAEEWLMINIPNNQIALKSNVSELYHSYIDHYTTYVPIEVYRNLLPNGMIYLQLSKLQQMRKMNALSPARYHQEVQTTYRNFYNYMLAQQRQKQQQQNNEVNREL